MAITQCPSCGKRISNKYHTCPHCGVTLDESGDGLTRDEAVRRLRIRETYRLQAQMYASILLFVIGCVWLWGSSDGFSHWPGFWPVAITVAGAMWYISVRIYMIVTRWRRKK